jgi:hypothetical protein
MNRRALMCTSGALLASIALVAGHVLAQAPAGLLASGFIIQGIDPDWIKRSGTEGPYTPDRACRLGVTKALVVADCTAAPDGALSACRIVQEQPSDDGFGQSVLAMAARRVLVATPVPPETGPQRVRLTIPIALPPGGCRYPAYAPSH